jgi:hypothetical protein
MPCRPETPSPVSTTVPEQVGDQVCGLMIGDGYTEYAAAPGFSACRCRPRSASSMPDWFGG